jgi:hypothetical protein
MVQFNKLRYQNSEGGNAYQRLFQAVGQTGAAVPFFMAISE